MTEVLGRGSSEKRYDASKTIGVAEFFPSLVVRFKLHAHYNAHKK